MNVGQILETHLGWASASLGTQVNKMISQLKIDGQTNDLKDKLLEIYDIDDHKEKIKNMNDDEVLEVTPKNLRLRKKYLDHHERKRMSKSNSQNV